MKPEDQLAFDEALARIIGGFGVFTSRYIAEAFFKEGLAHRDDQGAAVYSGPDWPLYELDAVISEQKAGRPFDAISLHTLVRVHEALAEAYNAHRDAQPAVAVNEQLLVAVLKFLFAHAHPSEKATQDAVFSGDAAVLSAIAAAEKRKGGE